MKNIKFTQILFIFLIACGCTISASNRPRSNSEIEEDNAYDAYVQRKLEEDPEYFNNIQKEDEDQEKRIDAIIAAQAQEDEAQERKINMIIAAQQEEDDQKYQAAMKAQQEEDENLAAIQRAKFQAIAQQAAEKALSAQNNHNVKIQAIKTRSAVSKGGSPYSGPGAISSASKPGGTSQDSSSASKSLCMGVGYACTQKGKICCPGLLCSGGTCNG